MIVRKQYSVIKNDKLIKHVDGYYLFGVLPLYVHVTYTDQNRRG